MRDNFSPSINLIRDQDKPFNYILTANGKRVFNQIINDYKIGLRCFNIIGSYGTGKSAFLLALTHTLTGQYDYFDMAKPNRFLKPVRSDSETNFEILPNVESEMYFRESFISPFMRQVWKRHPSLKLWISRKLAYKDELTGEPDYFISARPKGPTTDLVGKPLLAVAEAKQEDFIAGWGQCLAEMIACQKINNAEHIIIYGIVSAGEFWQFGKLEKETFTRNIAAYTIHEPTKLLGVLDYLFEQCEKQIL